MEKLIETFSAYPLWKKALIIAGLPLVVLFLFVRGAGTIAALFNSSSRQQVDKDSAALDQKIQATDREVAKAEGRVEELKESKDDAVKAQEQTDAVDFYNNRFKPNGDK